MSRQTTRVREKWCELLIEKRWKGTHGSVERKGHPWGKIACIYWKPHPDTSEFVYTKRKRKLEFGTLFYFLTGFRVESDSRTFKGNYILGPEYPGLTGF